MSCQQPGRRRRRRQPGGSSTEVAALVVVVTAALLVRSGPVVSALIIKSCRVHDAVGFGGKGLVALQGVQHSVREDGAETRSSPPRPRNAPPAYEHNTGSKSLSRKNSDADDGGHGSSTRHRPQNQLMAMSKINLASFEEKERREMEWLVRTTMEFLGRDDKSMPLKSGQVHRVSLLMKAWARRSSRRGSSNAPFIVERILRRLIQERDDGNSSIRIDTRLYNILLDAWSQSSEERAANRAERILCKMETLCDEEGNDELRPNESSYNACIKAYVKNGGGGSPSSRRRRGGRQEADDCIPKVEALIKRMESRCGSADRRGYNLLLYALANSSEDDAAKRADKILTQMIDCARPSTNTFNQVITCWSRGKEHGFEEKMMARFDELLSLPSLQPNTDTFNAIIGGWLKSKKPEALQRVLDTLGIMEASYAAGNLASAPDGVTMNSVMAAYAKNGGAEGVVDEAVRLQDRLSKSYRIRSDTVSNNILIDLWCKSRRPDAPARAMEMLDAMEGDYKGGISDMKPDAYTYSSIIDCFVKCGVQKAPEKAETVLDRMKELHLNYGGFPPDVSVYNAVINAWACSSSTVAVRRAEELLLEMETCGNNVFIPKPDRITYNTMVKAMNRGTKQEAARAEELLNALERRSLLDGAFQPDVYTFTAVISAYGRSDVLHKAEKTLELLERMIQSFEHGNKWAKPNTSAFNAALNACAFAQGDMAGKLNAFDIVVSVIALMKKHAKPDHTTYGTVLRACSSLLPPSDTRRELVVDRIFRQACQDGLVGKLVLTQLGFAATPDHFRKLTGFESAGEVLMEELPKSWTANVREKKYIRIWPGRNKRT